MKPLTKHWADIAAAKLVASRPEQEVYTLASGITPSGVVHIGNFREVITVDLVARALKSLGKKVRFLYSWDDFDTLRKVPKGMPKPEMLEENLRRPISRVPDPFGRSKSYAAHHIENFEEQLSVVGIAPEFLYQSDRYAQGLYAEGIRQALENKEIIRSILNEHRSKDLDESWLPTSVYCENCDRDEMHYQRYDGEWAYSYHCASCGHEGVLDIRNTKQLKLSWRTDWPMRWNFEKVDFEPGGKDHSSEGGSYDTAKSIVKQVWGGQAPQYLQYDFVSLKGGPGKMSSSAGGVVTVGDACKVYEPEMVRWIFASQRPNTDFTIAFDSDVIKVYDEYDRLEELALDETMKESKKWESARRNYELAILGELPSKACYRAPFRELCNKLQLMNCDIQKTMERFYLDEVADERDKEAFFARSQRAVFWLENHAPEEFCYRLNEHQVSCEISEQQARAVKALVELIERIDLSGTAARDLNQLIYDEVIRREQVDARVFFEAVYQKLISRDQGPRLPSFLKEIGRDKLLELLK